MGLKKLLWLVIALASSAGLARANGISYTCDPNIDSLGPANTCATLNTTIAGLYGSTFSNANASIYIQYGITGLGQSTSGFLNLVPYNTYLSALTAEGGPGAVRTDAIASLPGVEPALYSGGKIEVTSALGAALGLSGLVGTFADGTACFTPGSGGCYNGIITITTPANLSAESGGTQFLYYRTGPQAANAYDFFSVVQHETDEVLGTPSCVDTSGATLAEGCLLTNASAVDLFRYQGAGTRVFVNTTPGAYFSYNGGVTNGADGAFYNTLSNGNDYADFTTHCQHLQDAVGCLGGSFDLTNDGGPEINILDAVGYNLIATTPEPGTLLLLGAGSAALGLYRRRRGSSLKM